MKLRQGYILGFVLAALCSAPVIIAFGFLGVSAAVCIGIAACIVIIVLDDCLSVMAERRERDGSHWQPLAKIGPDPRKQQAINE